MPSDLKLVLKKDYSIINLFAARNFLKNSVYLRDLEGEFSGCYFHNDFVSEAIANQDVCSSESLASENQVYGFSVLRATPIRSQLE